MKSRRYSAGVNEQRATTYAVDMGILGYQKFLIEGLESWESDVKRKIGCLQPEPGRRVKYNVGRSPSTKAGALLSRRHSTSHIESEPEREAAKN